MLTPQRAARLRELIARHAHCQFQAGRLNTKTDAEVRARILAAADTANRVLCAELAALTVEEKEYENW